MDDKKGSWFDEEMKTIQEILLPDEERWLEQNDFGEDKAPVICIFTKKRIA